MRISISKTDLIACSWFKVPGSRLKVESKRVSQP
jgi:hypothetical protein